MNISGRVITDADIEALADEAERGYDSAQLIARRGPAWTTVARRRGPSTVGSPVSIPNSMML